MPVILSVLFHFMCENLCPKTFSKVGKSPKKVGNYIFSGVVFLAKSLKSPKKVGKSPVLKSKVGTKKR